MIIEYLYPEIGNLFGDSANIKILKQSIPEADFIETGINDTPAFVERDVSLIYMGPMTESKQLLALERLRPYRDRLASLIEGGTHFLMTGNSFELFGEYIEANGSRTDCLRLIDFHSKTNIDDRYNGFFLGERSGIEITGFNSRFSHCYPGEGVKGFAKAIRGIGSNKACAYEGIEKNNFIGTYLLGPVLVLNPLYLASLMKELGCRADKPAFFEAALDAYNKRLLEFKDEKRKLD